MKKHFDNAAERRNRARCRFGRRAATVWYLRQQVAASPYRAEIFSTHRDGFGVATTNSTSEFMRFDEDWWERGWMRGIWIGEGEYGESAGARSVDIPFGIYRPGGKDPLGVMKTVLAIEPVRKIADGSAPSIPGSRVAVATGRAAPIAELAERSARGKPVSPPVIEDREEIVRVTDSIRDLIRLCTRALQPGHAR